MDMENNEYQLLKENMRFRIESVRESVDQALRESGRDSDSLTLIGVSKFFPAEYAQAAYELGITDLGENRVQELLEKKEALGLLGVYPKWHLIGTLQTNKVRHIIGEAVLIHSVSSEELIAEIQKRSLAKGINTHVLLQVNVSGEESKHGFAAEEIEHAAAYACQCPDITLRGLMTMAPILSSGISPEPVFEKTRELFDRLKRQIRDPERWDSLSMGMSQDYIDAIRYGSTHIRVGTAIFGPRSY